MRQSARARTGSASQPGIPVWPPRSAGRRRARRRDRRSHGEPSLGPRRGRFRAEPGSAPTRSSLRRTAEPMGILDDAIRQHLDLKRRQGAEEDELQRLEDEAFGPPSRPGEPDFPGAAAEGETAGSSPDSGESGAVTEQQPPIESLDTVEHPFEDVAEDTGETELIEEPLPGEAPAPADAPPTDDLPPT